MRTLLIFSVFICLILLLPLTSAAFDLTVEEIEKVSVVISELDNEVVYDLVIDNSVGGDTAEVYSLAGISIRPKETFELPTGQTRIEITARLNEVLRKNAGGYSIEYQIRGQNRGIFKGQLPIRVVFLDSVFAVSVSKINPGDEDAVITVKNLVEVPLENVSLNFKSIFFDFTESFDLEPNGEVNLSAKIDEKRVSKLVAGPYVGSIELEVGEGEVKMDGVIDYLEKEGTSVRETSRGFLIRTGNVTKTNEGNVLVTAKIESKKDIISRLLTKYSEDPVTSERRGLLVYYSWEAQIGPGESYGVVTRTNYTFPFVVLVLIVFIALLVKYYSSGNVNVRKRVSLVRTKGGEFALKVRVSIKARKDVKDIEIIDRLPGMTKLYEGHGSKHYKLDEKSRKISWEIHRLNKSEERVFSYIIYSKVRAVGRFELPAATAVFKQGDRTERVQSNRAFFVSETARED